MNHNLKVIALVAVLVLAVLLYFFNPSEYQLAPKCPFKLLTGWSCPGCGFQRAMHASLHGDFTTAISYNLFLVYSFPYLIGLMLETWVLRGKWQERLKAVLEHRYAIYTYVVLFFVWGVVRNIYHL